MVELYSKGNQQALGQLESGLMQMLDSGVNRVDIISMVETIVDNHQVIQPIIEVSNGNGHDDEAVFTELPEGLIDIRTAAKKHGMNASTIRTWIHKGHLTVVGRLKAPARGGGYSVVEESQLLDYISAPKSRGGRPKKL